ncbi:hypothetical protein ACLOJK_017819 [Asimina triloba]
MVKTWHRYPKFLQSMAKRPTFCRKYFFLATTQRVKWISSRRKLKGEKSQTWAIGLLATKSGGSDGCPEKWVIVVCLENGARPAKSPPPFRAIGGEADEKAR